MFAHESLECLAQTGAFLLVLDSLGNANVAVSRQEDEVTRGDGKVRGQACALAAERILDDLHDDRASGLDEIGDVRVLRPPGIRYVRGMQKCRSLEAGIDESSLHPGQNTANLALVDVADDTPFFCPFDNDFLHHAVLDDGDTRLWRRDIDENLFTHALFS